MHRIHRINEVKDIRFNAFNFHFWQKHDDDEDIINGNYTPGDSIVNKYTSNNNTTEELKDNESKAGNSEITTNNRLRTFSETMKMLDDDVVADLNVK